MVYPLVCVESPYAGNVERHLRYGRACLRDCFRRGEFPFASHLLYTQPGVLRDDDPKERARGMLAGFFWAEHAQRTVVYEDLGISRGMVLGIKDAEACKRPVEYRKIGWVDNGS